MPNLDIMIEHIFVFPTEEDLPLSFITWARKSQPGVSMRLQFSDTHTNVIVQGEIISVFNSCLFVLGQWFQKIMHDPEGGPEGELPDFDTTSFTDWRAPSPEELAKLSGNGVAPVPGNTEIFNPGKKKNLSVDEMMGPAMRIKDPEEAEKYLNDYIDFVISNHSLKITRSQGEYICKSNLSAYSERCGRDVVERVEKLFNCSLKELKKLLKSK